MNKLILIAVILLYPTGAFCSENAQEKTYDSTKTRVLSRITSSISEVQTIISSFAQEKHSALFENIHISHGRFFYQRPDHLRWEHINPRVYGFSVKGNMAKRWKGNKSIVQDFDLNTEPIMKAFINMLFSITSADFDELEKSYIITVLKEDPTVIKLVPSSKGWKKHLGHLTLFFSQEDNPLHTVEIHEPDGDFTRIRFDNTIINQPIQPDMF